MATKPRITGTTGIMLTGAWGLHSTFTTVKDLPGDASGLAKMLTDPPVYAPWLLFAAFVVILAWSFWPSRARPSDSHHHQGSAGHQSPNILGNNNTINIHGGQNTQPVEPVEKFDQDAWFKGWDAMGRVTNELIRQSRKDDTGRP